MEIDYLLRYCLEKGFLIDDESFKLLKEVGDIETVKILLEKISQQSNAKIISKNFFYNHQRELQEIISTLPNEKQIASEVLKLKLGLSIEISKGMTLDIPIKKGNEVYNESNVKVISSHFIKSRKLSVHDFVKHLRARFSEIKNILQERSELENLISIDKISGNRQGICLIGMVKSKRMTKNKNMILEIEDLTGTIGAIVNLNKPEILKKGEEVTLDSIIAIKCSGTKEMVFVNDIIFPDSVLAQRKKSPVEEYALFIGDTHIGSDRFMEKNFLSFISYLNGDLPDTPEVEKIKYLFFVGDLIAGVGEYPGQERDLIIGDVEGQYEKAAGLLKLIRDDIKIIIIPGNHDAVRLMEPQPTLDERYAWPLHEMHNVILSTNPSVVNIGELPEKKFPGFDVLMYHGFSYFYYRDNIPSLREAKYSPDKVMAYLLKNRHLAPTHTSATYCPSDVDSLLIKKVPDIFFSGHTHKSAVSYYNNILVISASSWETKSPYQEKMGNHPDFCKVPMLN